MERAFDDVVVTSRGNLVDVKENIYFVDEYETLEFYEDLVVVATNLGDEIWYLTPDTWLDLYKSHSCRE